MEKKTKLNNNTYLIETALFITSSAREVVKWQQYGSLRLYQTLIKFLDLPNKIDVIKKDEFLEKIKQEMENNMSLRRDEEKYEKFLDSLIVKMHYNAKLLI